ncbi:MAG: homoserine O-succinyltransferase [Candidatus Acidiferrales bacterium]
MSITIDGGRVPNLLSRKNRSRAARSADNRTSRSGPVRIALINNMPDSALEDTEVQFFELLESAAGDIPLSLKLYSLPELSRNDAGRKHLDDFYSGISDLLNSRFDGVIVTGTEPLLPDLRDEPYWPALTEVLDWAEGNTTSTVLSCLAAHAGVLYSDGIPRHRLPDKQFGVFEYKKVRGHALTEGLGDGMQIPHSRWNEVRADALTSCGYEILTQSAEAGVDLFVKKKKNSFFVHFQGHPEYETRTLLKEFRRDIKRFLRRDRESYPTMPEGYFDPIATKLLSDFQESVIADPREELLARFPEAAISEAIQGTWQKSAATVYSNWLRYLITGKADASSIRAATPAVRG